MQRRKFSREFKVEAVHLVCERGVSVAQASRDIDVHENVLRKWVKDFGSDPKQAFPGHGQQPTSRGSRYEVRLCREAPGVWPVAWLCEALGVSRSGFHAWLRRGPSERSLADEAMMPAVLASFVASARTYGARRVWRDVLETSVSCGLHKIERLMHANALRARLRRRALPRDDGQRLTATIAPNVLDRQFTADQPNKKWIADFTYVWTAEGWLYVAAVIDLFSRRVVGWSMKAEMNAQLITDTLIMVIWRRGQTDVLLHHLDRGSQYNTRLASEHFQRLMADNGVNCSMSRSGNVWDNAAMESFFSSLKTERIGRKVYRSRDAARGDVFDYIERFYNTIRRHSTIGYLSRVEFERKMGLA